ncbi:MAG: ankyrin repeat domain-containing protein [Agriterribacter sp.]
MKRHFVVFLVSSFFTVSSYSQPLLAAVEEKKYSEVEQLIAKGEKVNKTGKKGQFPLWIAVWNHDVKMVELLMKHGADAKQYFKTKDGKTSCLEISCQEGDLEIAKLLVDGGADPDQRGLGGHTPLRIAARNGRIDLVKYFIGLKCEVDTRGDDGATPLEHAATKGHFEIVQLLVENGADINIQDNDGDFPLGEAIKYGHIEVVKYLLSKDTDLSLKNKKGMDAAELARVYGQPKIAELLKEAVKS